MRLLRASWLVVLMYSGAFAAEIDFRPTLREYVAEGIAFKQLIFRQDKQLISYEPPRLWSCRPAGGGLQLIPPQGEIAEGLIKSASVKEPLPTGELGMVAAKGQVQAELPPSSQNVVILEQGINSVALDGSTTYEIKASYAAFGQTFIRSTVLVNRPDVQITFRLSARKADFEALYKAFRSSIVTWRWMQPEPKTAQVTASGAPGAVPPAQKLAH